MYELDGAFFFSSPYPGLNSKLPKESLEKKQDNMFVKILSVAVNAFFGLSILHYSAKMFDLKFDSKINILSNTGEYFFTSL